MTRVKRSPITGRETRPSRDRRAAALAREWRWLVARVGVWQTQEVYATRRRQAAEAAREAARGNPGGPWNRFARLVARVRRFWFNRRAA